MKECYRKAVTSQSPGLLQPWERELTNPTATRLRHAAMVTTFGDPGRNPFRVGDLMQRVPRVEATLGCGT
jgi:hypothetical protein